VTKRSTACSNYPIVARQVLCDIAHSDSGFQLSWPEAGFLKPILGCAGEDRAVLFLYYYMVRGALFDFIYSCKELVCFQFFSRRVFR